MSRSIRSCPRFCFRRLSPCPPHIADVVLSVASLRCPGSEKDITEVSGTSSPGSIPGRGNSRNLRRRTLRIRSPAEGAPTLERLPFCLSSGAGILALLHDLEPALDLRGDLFTSHRVRIAAHVGLVELQH